MALLLPQEEKPICLLRRCQARSVRQSELIEVLSLPLAFLNVADKSYFSCDNVSKIFSCASFTFVLNETTVLAKFGKELQFSLNNLRKHFKSATV